MSQDRYQRIWDTVCQIPAGKVAAYGQIADLAGLPGRARLVGKALGESPSPLPWYRVLRANGQLAFAPGSENAREQADRLAEEGVEVLGNRVDLRRHRWQPDLAEMLFRLKY